VRAFTRDVMSLIETGMRRIVKGTAEAFGATAEGDFRMIFAPTVNDAAQADFVAGVCAEVVGEDNVNRNPCVMHDLTLSSLTRSLAKVIVARME
jgi:metal-dependent amidase/aminoacylase/carboxypeptidase family protein